MSIRIALDKLSDEQKVFLANELEFTPNATIYGPSEFSVLVLHG